MVDYIRSDLEFILQQIKIAEAHAAGQSLYGPGGLIPSYNIAWGLRTVDGTYNHLLPGQEQWGAADREFPELMEPEFRTVTVMMDPDGPGPAPLMPVSMPYTPGNDVDGPGTFAGPGDVIDPEPRTISNLIVDQTLNNPVAIMAALQRNGIEGDHLAIAAEINAAFEPIAGLFDTVTQAEVAYATAQAAADANPGDPALAAAAEAAALALADAQSALDGARGFLDALLAANGIEMDGENVQLTNIAPDEGLSASFNSWFTLFGQFFDHGLDLVNKGGNGSVMIPLQPDDPLYVPGSQTNFMVLTRATTSPGADGVLGDNPLTVGIDESADDGRPVNTTTSFVDQNQTYTSHPSHQVFLRQYVLNGDGQPVATGHLIEGGNGGMANWGEVKAQAATILGIQLTDADVGKVPLLRTDPYGNFIPGENGFPQLIVGIGVDGIPNTADDIVVEGNPGAPVDPTEVGAIRTSHAFLADIAHNAVPEDENGLLVEDGDIEVGGNIPVDGEYDNELLDAHFIAGDGRANENIGLTAVHHVFHSEHNRLVEHTKEVALSDAAALLAGGASQADAVAFLNEWLIEDVATVPVSPAEVAGLVWDGERLFQAAKFGTEMQYQHLVFEEFARKVQPAINTFLVPDGFDTTMDPSIFAEFAHVVYRFGHSMLTETIDQFDPDFAANPVSLIQGFLNPTAFNGTPGPGSMNDEIAAGAIIRGMTRQAGNEIDEFVTSALRNNLLGLPLDLATINLARGRDTGVPSLNEARRTFYEATNQNVLLKPYESWIDFAGNLKHEASIINFIAAYGTHSLITGQTTIDGKRDAALTIITNTSVGGLDVPADAVDFLNGTGAYAGNLGGLENVDLWIGGLAEQTMPFGGMLGSTFNFVFEVQMELLQSGDRFYYLQRLDGLHLFGEMENNSFASMIMRNTDATHLPSDVFSTPGLILEVNQARQFNDLDGDGTLESADPTGGGILTQLVVRQANDLRYNGDQHVVIGGTDADNRLTAGIGDDTLYGDAGNDRLDGGFGNDIINGGEDDDIIVDAGGDDNIKGGSGNDVIHSGPGLDLVLAGAGQDFVFLGTDEGSEVFAGEGNDFIYGNKNAERILGNEGDDWIETGTFDGAPGDNFDEIFARDGVAGHDVFLGDGGFDEFIAEGGDDIMVGSLGAGKMVGMSGFDWATYKNHTAGINVDLATPIIFDENPVLPENASLDGYESVEGLSGTGFNDILRGTNETAATLLPLSQGGTGGGYLGSALDAEGIARIGGLQTLLGAATSFASGDIILGGGGNDQMFGADGNDILHGDKWLNVQIGVFAPEDTEHTGTPLELHNSMTTLATRMFSGEIGAGQLSIVRQIVEAAGGNDTLVGGTGADRLDGGAGIDTVSYAGSVAAVFVRLHTGPAGSQFAGSQYAFGGDAAGDTLVGMSFENATGGDGNDDLIGNSGANVLDGSAGNDALNGYLGADTLQGGLGDDVLIGGAGGDTLNGGAGIDTVSYAGSTAAVFVRLHAGPTGSQFAFGGDAGGDTLVGLSFENAIGGNGNDDLIGSIFANVLDGGAGNDTINGFLGDDVIRGGAGADTVTLTGNQGRDLIDGGADVDTFTLNGVAGAETFYIYARAAAEAAGMTGLNANTEIVITRNGTTNAQIVAELDNIEEINVNALNVSSPGGVLPGGTGANGGDTIVVIGDFNPTSLNFNTITVNGGGGSDTVNISGLTSEHRLVFNSGGGIDSVIGDLRAQDVVDFGTLRSGGFLEAWGMHESMKFQHLFDSRDAGDFFGERPFHVRDIFHHSVGELDFLI